MSKILDNKRLLVGNTSTVVPKSLCAFLIISLFCSRVFSCGVMVAWKNFFSSVVLTATSAGFLKSAETLHPGLPASQSCLVYSVHAAPAHDFNVHVFFKPSQAIVSDLILALPLKLEYVLVSTKPRLETTSSPLAAALLCVTVSVLV